MTRKLDKGLDYKEHPGKEREVETMRELRRMIYLLGAEQLKAQLPMGEWLKSALSKKLEFDQKCRILETFNMQEMEQVLLSSW